jgi:hypothetical protein
MTISKVMPPGKMFKYGYIHHGLIRFQDYGGLYLPAVQKYLETIVDLGGGFQLAECPVGRWEEGSFVIMDGRHKYCALVIAGFEYLLVRWVEDDG